MKSPDFEPITIPKAPNARRMTQRLTALVAEPSHSVRSESEHPFATAAHHRVYDLATRFAQEDTRAQGKPLYTFRSATERGVPYMILSNFQVPPDFGRTNQLVVPADVVIFAHGDIVEAQNLEQHKLRIDGDRAYGRATADMKNGFLSGSWALAHAPSNRRVAVVGYADEEYGDSPTIYHLQEVGLQPTIAVQYDGEPVPEGMSNISYVNSGKAMMRFDVNLPGDKHVPASHAARPHLAEDVLQDRFNPFIADVQRPISRGGLGILRRRSRSPRATTWVFKINRADPVASTTASYLGGHVDLRTATEDIALEAWKSIAEVAVRHGLEAQEPHRECPEYKQSAQTPEVVLYREIGKNVMGGDMVIRADVAGNDLSKLNNNVVTILSGIRGEDSHGPNEWVSIPAVQQASQIQAAYMQQLPAILARQNGRAL